MSFCPRVALWLRAGCRTGLAALLLASCARVKDPPLPSFSRARRGDAKRPIEAHQSVYFAIDRCIDASEQDLLDPQHRDRARLLCRQAGLELQRGYAQDDRDKARLQRALADLQGALPHQMESSPKIDEPLALLREALDQLHDRDDHKLLALLRGRDAVWRAEGISLWLAIRRWRRCQERASKDPSPPCRDSQQLTRVALHRFGQGLAQLPGEAPFGTRSFRRCAERSFLANAAGTESFALVAPSSPQALRSCERMAARIPWDPS